MYKRLLGLLELELDCCTSKTASWFCCWKSLVDAILSPNVIDYDDGDDLSRPFFKEEEEEEEEDYAWYSATTDIVTWRVMALRCNYICSVTIPVLQYIRYKQRIASFTVLRKLRRAINTKCIGISCH